ncbi:ribosomal protein S18 [Chytridium lagenaria]|nr:ribosomal protein S18 [Chytridium lagenaria]
MNLMSKRCVHVVAKYNSKKDPDFFQSMGGLKRLFKPYQTYDPEELNQRNLEKFKKMKPVETVDVFKKLKIDPLSHYKNGTLLAHFVTETGSIKPRVETGLSLKSQNRLSKAIKRAQAFGLMPYTYKV